MLPAGVTGYWGPVTSTVDWCEDNYRVTMYVAEFFNTLSGLPLVLLAGYALLLSARRGSLQGSFCYTLACVLNITVGVGSMAFHGTLTRLGQVLDEVPMLWCSCSCVLVLLTVQPEPCFREYKGFVMPLVVFAWAAAATGAYFYCGFGVFVGMYFCSVVAAIVLGYRRMLSSESPGHKALALRLLAVCGGAYTAASFAFWIPEMYSCGNRVQTAHASVFQHLHAHAIFHLLAGVAHYSFLLFAAILQLEEEGRKGELLWNPAPVIVVVAL
ncbi:putative alkaline ceramidase dcd3B [Diplonema papillatum]|nr:putative alkaline ceramidase dcd3B [Diplonema papillatum]|eukprot:gene15167-23164_t